MAFKGNTLSRQADRSSLLRAALTAMVTLLLFAGSASCAKDKPKDVASGSGAGTTCKAGPAPAKAGVELPRDDATHANVQGEEWYWNGRVRDAGGAEVYAFLLGFFWVPRTETFWTDYAIIDLVRGEYHSGSSFIDEPPPAVKNRFSLVGGNQLAVGGGGKDTLRIAVDGLVLSLDVRETLPGGPVVGGGHFEPANGDDFLNYMRQAMRADGTLSTGGRKLTVSGTALFDREIGNLSGVFSGSWIWIPAELADGTALLATVAKDADGKEIFASATLTHPDCRVEQLANVSITASGTCSSQQGWQIRAKDFAVDLKPSIPDQTMRDAAGLNYWDGDANIVGTTTGRAWVDQGWCA